MTSAERARVLDEQLRKGYEVFDGIILDERERNQDDRNANPGGFGGAGDSASESGGTPGVAGLPQTLPPSGSGSEPQVSTAQLPASSAAAGESFPPPDDIPSGRDDDVVARQLREAATREPDPELREALWEEYRNYTGISEQ